MRGPLVRWFLALCLTGCTCLLAQPFFFRKDIRVAEAPMTVVAGDFNGDRRPDLAVDAWNQGLFVLLNTGGGNFGRPIRTGGGLQYRLGLPMVADFSGDGKDDLVTTEGVLLSRGDGTFQPTRLSGNAVAVGDFNRDGKSDLVSHRGDTGTLVLLSNGDGTFQSGARLSDRLAILPAVADFNRDGRSDVALLSPAPTGPLSVFLGNGDGTFGPEIPTSVSGDAVWPEGVLLAADFSGDGLPDLATPSGILLGKGDGSFSSLVRYLSLEPPSFPLAAADFTGDSKADLVVRHRPANSISIFPGKGDGTFLPLLEQPVGWGWVDVYAPGATVDLDGDGRLDLVAANDSSNTVSLLMAKAQGGPALRRAVSAASHTAIVAPQSLATLFAPTTATVSASASPPWPTRVGGISLEVRDSAGATHLAPLLFVSPTQINFQVPAGVALGEATLAIVSDRGTTEAGSMQVDAVAPALFMASHSSLIPAATGILVEPGGTQVPVSLLPVPLSKAGDRPIYLSFFGTGFRGANTDSVTCTINGVQIPVVYAGPQQTPRLDQINIRLLPYEVLILLEDIFFGWEVILSIDGVAANTASIGIQ